MYIGRRFRCVLPPIRDRAKNEMLHQRLRRHHGSRRRSERKTRTGISFLCCPIEGGCIKLIQADFSNAHTDLSDPALAERVAKIHERLHHHPDLMCGWVEYPFQVSDAALERIIAAADAVRNRCSVFIVIGIGGPISAPSPASVCCVRRLKNAEPSVIHALSSPDSI